MLAVLALTQAINDCPTAAMPPALTDKGRAARRCFFGNDQAAENTLRLSADDANCTQTGHPPVCSCPESALATAAPKCSLWANDLMRYYTFQPEDESQFVKYLSQVAKNACATSGGKVIPPELKPSIKADSATPACHNIQPAAPADVAAFTAYMVVVTAASVFSLFEMNSNPLLLFKEEQF